ncbi:MAG: HPr family phosphocarrier protein [Clostridia bacterium]|nr:MAG: HPr family phosphocarrier protein [Clostridia bacterium]
MPSTILTVTHPAGLHARPAAAFVKTAATFPCTITVRNLSSDKPAVNAKSILGVLTQGVNQGHQIEISAEGEDADRAIATLSILIANNFDEGEK